MSVSSVVSLTDFTADEIPTKKWMKLFCPKLRLRLRVQHRDFVSSTVNVQSTDATGVANISWPWNDSQRPCFSDDETFEVEAERRFLIGYKCIRRTKLVTINQIRASNRDYCALSLYDGEKAADALDDGIVIGEVMFTLQSDTTSNDTSSSQPCDVLITS